MKLHDLKCWPPYFEDVVSGTKSFEVRRNDRKFEVGDVLRLREWEPKTEIYTGRDVFRRVAYMVHGMGQVGVVGPLRGLSTGYVVLALSSEDIDWDVVDRALKRGAPINADAEADQDPCPECGAKLNSALGGGVKCSNEKCSYWFCF